MSRKATDFADAWVQENISPEAYDPPRSFVEALVRQFEAEATAAGLSADELYEGVGDSYDFISQALEEATDSEVERLASKDD